MKVEVTVERTVRSVATVVLDAGEDEDQWHLFDRAASVANDDDSWKETEATISKTRSICRVIDSGLVAP